MGKFRRKPLIVEAEQWFENKKVEGVYTTKTISAGRDGSSDPVGFIETLEGVMVVNPGDWIITGIEGEKYACKESVFEKTYEIYKEEPEIKEKVSESKYMTIKGIVESKKYPFTTNQVRWFLYMKDTNGLSDCVSYVGARVVIRSDLFDKWIESKKYK